MQSLVPAGHRLSIDYITVQCGGDSTALDLVQLGTTFNGAYQIPVVGVNRGIAGTSIAVGTFAVHVYADQQTSVNLIIQRDVGTYVGDKCYATMSGYIDTNVSL
jgi:hypothetical protein